MEIDKDKLPANKYQIKLYKTIRNVIILMIIALGFLGWVTR